MTSASALYVLHETAAGYALFDVVELDEVASLSPELQKALADRDGFKRICKLRAFVPFASAEMALENINAIAEHSVPDRLRTFLETNLPAVPRPRLSFRGGIAAGSSAAAVSRAPAPWSRTDEPSAGWIAAAPRPGTRIVRGGIETFAAGAVAEEQ